MTLNEKETTIKIIHPVKGHFARTIQVSNRLLAMIIHFQRNAEGVFDVRYGAIAKQYYYLKELAETQKNPRLLSIELGPLDMGATQIAWHTNGNIFWLRSCRS